MSDEPRYTLDEARRELEKLECHRQGHDFEIIVCVTADPDSVLCRRCGRSWNVFPDPPPDSRRAKPPPPDPRLRLERPSFP